jgi:hypothetical protein
LCISSSWPFPVTRNTGARRILPSEFFQDFTGPRHLQPDADDQSRWRERWHWPAPLTHRILPWRDEAIWQHLTIGTVLAATTVGKTKHFLTNFCFAWSYSFGCVEWAIYTEIENRSVKCKLAKDRRWRPRIHVYAVMDVTPRRTWRPVERRHSETVVNFVIVFLSTAAAGMTPSS